MINATWGEGRGGLVGRVGDRWTLLGGGAV